MTTDTTLQTLKPRVADALDACGWPKVDSTAIAIKSFDTAVGPKEAQVYLEGSPGAEQYTLKAQYYSEGRNALESTVALIPAQPDDETLQQLVAKFAADADMAVSQTYAARLLAAGTVSR